MAVIEIQGLTKRFGSVLAVDNLSFDINEGAVVGFLGPNGAGKTTTLRMLLGLIEPTAGTALFHGVPYRDLTDRPHQVGAMLEAAAIHPGRTPRGHLRVRAAAARLDPARIDAWVRRWARREHWRRWRTSATFSGRWRRMPPKPSC